MEQGIRKQIFYLILGSSFYHFRSKYRVSVPGNGISGQDQQFRSVPSRHGSSVGERFWKIPNWLFSLLRRWMVVVIVVQWLAIAVMGSRPHSRYWDIKDKSKCEKRLGEIQTQKSTLYIVVDVAAGPPNLDIQRALLSSMIHLNKISFV